MHPPAERLRILQSVEVDETNPDYIAAKAKQRAKLKDKFESLFSKYEALPDAMTDEIDMRTGEIVVDRGHMRRLNKEYVQRLGKRGNRPGQLLDDLFGDELEDAADDDGSTEEDPRDELAPQSPEPRNRKQDAPKNDLLPAVGAAAIPTALPNQSAAQMHSPSPYTPTGASTSLSAHTFVPNASSPAANWMQMVQFPQTPAGQLAQSAFMQQITQAVQQAITPILSNMLSRAPILQQEDVNPITSIIPTTVDDEALPITSPSLRTSPPVEMTDSQVVSESSPLPISASIPPRRRFFAKGVYVTPRRSRRSPPPAPQRDATLSPIGVKSLCTNEVDKILPSSEESQVGDPNHIAPKHDKPNASKYSFDEEDDLYIIEQRTVSKRRWTDIKNSRSKWAHWPLYALYNRWNYLKVKTVGSTHAVEYGMKMDMHTTQTQKETRSGRPRKLAEQGPKSLAVTAVKSTSPTTSHHLPTPSSLEHDEAKDQVEEPETPKDVCSLIASGGHFDEDDRDLLSIAGGDENNEGSELEEYDTIQVIIPSVELEVPMNYNTTAEHTSIEPEVNDTTPKLEAPPPVSSTAKIPSSPGRPRKKLKLINFQVESDSEDELNLVDAGLSSGETRSNGYTYKRQAFNTSQFLKPYKTNPSADDPSPTPEASHEHICHTEEDELLAPATPMIKRETCTPPPNFLIATPTLQIPRSAPQPTTVHSSGGKGKPAPIARSVFLKKVKQSWVKSARKSTPGPKINPKSRGFHSAKRKRASNDNHDDDGDTVDELAM
jgi:hypothetical protein